MSVELIVEGAVAKVVLNRPERMNALTWEMREQLTEYFHRVRFDDAVRAVIVTGAGKNFCAGADVTQDGQGRFAREPRAAAARQPELHPPAPRDREAGDRGGARRRGRRRLEHRAGLRPRGVRHRLALRRGVPQARAGAGRRQCVVPGAPCRHGARERAGVLGAHGGRGGGGEARLGRAGGRRTARCWRRPRRWRRTTRKVRPSRWGWRRS